MAFEKMGAKPVGSIVKIKENGVPIDYLVVHQGQPSALYDASCNGTWLLRKDVLDMRTWTGSENSNDYANSQIHQFLNGEFMNRLDASTREWIKQVKIPYREGSGNYTTPIKSGANGLSCKIFLLGAQETGNASWLYGVIPVDSNKLDYFAMATSANDSHASRIAYLNGNAVIWWTRSPYCNPEISASFRPVLLIHALGGIANQTGDAVHGCRPALVMPSHIYSLGDGTFTTNSPPITPTSINVPGSISGGTSITVSWGAATDAEGNLAGYIVEKSTNGGSSWAQIYQGGALSTVDAVAFGTPTVIYRVKAYDAEGLHSGYCTGNQVAVVNNRAPGAPVSINVPLTVEGGKNLTVTWGAGSDADGNLAGYCLERSVNNAAFAEIFRGNALSHTHAITKGWNTVAYRVRAYDAYTAYRGYTTSAARAVNNNTPPSIVCTSANGSDLGVKSAGFSISYSVADVDGDAVSVTEAVDGVSKRTYNATLGASNSFAVTGEYFQKLLNGTRTMTVTAGDGKVSATHTLRFSKSVTAAAITLAIPMNADAKLTLAALSVTGSIPGDADYSVEVTNNAKDTVPVWENCTAAVKNGANHVFANQTATNGFAFNFRLSVKRGASGIGGHITSIQGGFQ